MNHAKVEESDSLEELEIAMAEDLDIPAPEAVQTHGQGEEAAAEPAEASSLPQLKRDLQELKKGGLGGANSARFDAVTEGIDNISNAFNAYPITGDLMRDESRARLILELYDSLVKHCNKYIGHRLVLTSAGRARRNQVRRIKETALQDIKGLSQWNLLLLEYPPEMRSTVTWSDLISNNRTEHIQVENFHELRTMGAGASTNYLVDEEQGLDKLYFFKKELNHTYGKPLEQAWEHVLASIEPTEENAALLGVLKGLRDDPEISRVIDKYAETPMEIPDEANLVLSGEQKLLLPQVNGYLIKVGAEMQKKITQDGLLRVAGYKAGETVNISRRNVATSVVAELLGVGHLSAQSRSAVIHDANTGENLSGNLMAKAQGNELNDLIAGKNASLGIGFTPKTAEGDEPAEQVYLNGIDALTMKFMLQTNSLQILDALCAQQDRHLGNAFYQTDEEGRLSGIQAIDNDASFGLNTSLISTLSGSGTGYRTIASTFDQASNKISLNLPYVEYDFAQAIIQLSPSVARFSLMGLIEEREVAAFLDRLSQIKELLSEALGNFESKKAAGEELDPSKGDIIFLKESELDENDRVMKTTMLTDMTIAHLAASFHTGASGNQILIPQKSIFSSVMANINSALWNEIKNSHGISIFESYLTHRLKYAK